MLSQRTSPLGSRTRNSISNDSCDAIAASIVARTRSRSSACLIPYTVCRVIGRVGRQPVDPPRVIRQPQHIRFEIALPEAEVRRVGGQRRSLLALAQRVFDALSIGDVGLRADETPHGAIGIEDRRAASEEPARGSILVDHAILGLERWCRAVEQEQCLDGDPRRIVGMKQLLPVADVSSRSRRRRIRAPRGSDRRRTVRSWRGSSPTPPRRQRSSPSDSGAGSYAAPPSRARALARAPPA